MEALGHGLVDRDPEASAFYLDLVEAEGRHRTVYLDIAAACSDAGMVLQRFGRIAQKEREAIEMADDEIRLHSGHGGYA